MGWLNDILDNDRDPSETQEWLESLKAVLDHDGPDRAHELSIGNTNAIRTVESCNSKTESCPSNYRHRVPLDSTRHALWRGRFTVLC